MDNNNMISLIRQYAQEGKDINAFIADYDVLASAGKTALGLNQWVKSDKPTMADFNEDNRIIDERLRELAAGNAVTDEKVQHLTETKADKDGKLQDNLYAEKSQYYTQTYINAEEDFNDITRAGVYATNPDVRNAPANAYFAVYVTNIGRADRAYTQQLAISIDGVIYIRTSRAGVWRSWSQLATKA